MFYEHPAFQQPKYENVSLWRYMDFTKFLLLLESSSLYFCRADRLRKDDAFEGSFPKKEYEYLIKNIGEESTHNIYNISSKSTFVNCWHYSDKESIAMWKLYSEINKGVAIKTTVSNFTHSFHKIDTNVFAGIVQYIDFEKDSYYAKSDHKYRSGNLFTAYIHKRNIFEYEKEYRAIISDHTTTEENGFDIKVDLSMLVKEVVVAPNTPNWLFELIVVTTHRYVQDANISRSIFETKPYF